ncbi:MAG: hypothetical protein K0R51_413 [Cytophagaceae bacterium]|jgi:hypothetical protein|nr:hypothetical protein [Cytophagaceae bacterium]
MTKKTIFAFLFIFTFCFSTVKAQEGREWIVSGQPYYKIPVAEEGVYRIPLSDLNTAGVSLVDPSKLQIWFRGVEQSIQVDATDLYFYGKGNDGTLDSLLYEPYTAQSNKYYSLFSDTTYYFLTVGSSAGKRLTNNLPNPTLAQANHVHTETIFYADEYALGALYSADTHLSTGDFGEGWVSSSISRGGTDAVSRTIEIPISNLYTGPTAGNAELEIMLVGTNQNGHRVEILIGDPSSPSAVYAIPTSFNARQNYKFTQSLPLNYLTNNQPLKVTVRLQGGSPNNPDMVALTYIVLKYPQTTNLSGKSFYFIEPVKDNVAKTLSLSNFTANSFLWDLSAEWAYVNLTYSLTGGTATVDVSGSTTKILYVNTFKSIIGIASVNMDPYPVLASTDMLLITHPILWSSVADYVTYRQSLAGGGIDIAVSDVTKLYNLYSYGEKHPIAIKRYCKEQLNTGTPKYLFLVGKGINYNYEGNTDEGYLKYRKKPTAFINNTYRYQQLYYRMEDLIPAYGWPASDHYYTITDGTLRPKLTTGRLSARTNADVLQYLDKVKANDQAPSDAIWRKHLVHLSGGKNASEVQLFENYVNGFKSIAEGPRFGGKVVRSYKKDLTVGAVDTKLIYSVADEVNKGLSYITFFGHSSPSVIDLDIGNVSNTVYGYDNKGKYPLLFMNGCQSAEFFIQGSIPEDWTMTPELGSLMTLGHGDIGYPQYMQKYTELFYKFNFRDNRFINSSVGDIQSKTLDTFLTIYQFDFNKEIVKAQATQFILQGDPAIKLYKPLKTDYAIAGDGETGEKKVFIAAIGNGPVTAMSDAFNLAIPITNYGLSDPDSIQIMVKHTVTSNGTVTINRIYPLKVIAPIGYVDTVYFTIPAKDANLFGINKFEITIDPNDSIDEFNESNNIATLEYFLSLSSVSCIYPSEFSVVHDQPVNFVAQSIDLFQDTRTYYVEIDTSHLYNSPSKIVRTISSGALVKFTQSLLTDLVPSDSLVYYWRIRFNDLVAGEDTLWGESSFIYIKNSPEGWSQSEYPQYFKNTYKNISVNAQGLSFTTTTAKLYVKTQGSDSTNVEIGYNNNTLVAFIPGNYQCPFNKGGYVVVFDGESTVPYLLDQSLKCGPLDNPLTHQFSDLSSTTTQNQLEDFLNNIPDGETVLFVSSGSASVDTWSSSLKEVFTDKLGAEHIPDLGAQTPYILLAKKGAGTTPLKEMYSTDPSTVLLLEETNLLKGTYKSGSITSTLIGPSTLWGTMYKTVKRTNDDFAELKVIRMNGLGVAVDTIAVPLDGDVDLAPLVNATAFPYIRLLMNTSDTTDFTPADLKKWQVIYAPVPEGTLDPYKVGIANYPKGTYDIGTEFNIPFSFENISTVDFPDTLRVVFFLKNEFGKIKRDTVNIGLLPKGQATTFNYILNTSEFPGKNTFQAYVNPQFQPEVYYQNNFIVLNYNVQEDKIHPVIGALFDGMHIFDGDLVSPNPTISVVLKDNNNLMTMDSSTTFNITLQYPNGELFEIPYKTNQSFIIGYVGHDPTDKSRFRLEFNPTSDFPDGKYKLIIQGRDASGNRSAAQNLEVNFTVLNQSTITNFYPYPNPFSTSCRFVFTLTGKEIPEDVKIQIMTVSGKVVREIFKDELGSIHIGDNITDYAWDGRDEYGDKLANGVYIYRVIIKNQNDKFEHRETSGDKAFKKGYGKLYILR